MKPFTKLLNYPAETLVYLVLLVFLNLPGIAESASLFPSALHPGDYWRWLTFPWAHISIYHLVLDATAFICLYDKLRGNRARRVQHLVLCIAFSGLLPILLDPRIATIGLRGLSGVAHGLMLIVAIEAASHRDRSARGFGILVFVVILGKCLIEQFTGSVLFAEYHLGNVGVAVPSCHVGGALGGLLSLLCVQFYKNPFALVLRGGRNDRTDVRCYDY